MAHYGGLHTLLIGADGLHVYPQAEALPDEPAPRFDHERAGFDLPELDRILGGGLNRGTTTMLAGSPGTGKTLASLHFLAAGGRRGEAGLLLGFQESEAQVLAKAAGFDLDLADAVASGTVQIVNCSPFWLDPDVIAYELRARVDEHGVRRLVIDSSRELERSLDPIRAPEYLAALVAFLRSRRVTTLLTREIPKIVGAELDFSDSAAAVLAENVMLFRHVKYRAELYRLVSVSKMRFSDHDRGLYEFRITDRGLDVGGHFTATEGILTGIARGMAVEAP